MFVADSGGVVRRVGVDVSFVFVFALIDLWGLVCAYGLCGLQMGAGSGMDENE